MKAPAYGSCESCQFCKKIIGKGANGPSTVAWYCRRHAPSVSDTVVVSSGNMIVTRGMWPAVNPDCDGCAEYMESKFV